MIARIARCSVSAAMFSAAVFLVPAVGESTDEPLPVQIELKLVNAVFRGDDPSQNHASLLLNIRRVGDRWERVIGTAGNLSRGIHIGHVTAGEITDDAIRLTLRIHVVGDGYTQIDERANFQLDLKRSANRHFAGPYSGTFKGARRDGKAVAERLPALRPPRAGFEPIRPGEHPRVLFRTRDLPALRKKAKTPLGKVAMAKMNDPVGLGVKYQLTGEKEYAEQARALVEPLLQGNYDGIRAPGSHHGMLHWGPFWEEPLVAYDLCCDAWPETFRRRVERFLWLWTRRIFYQHRMFNTQAQYDFGNSEAGWFHYAPALGGLVLWGEKGPAPAEPLPPDAVTEIPPAHDYQPAAGVPVLKLTPGKPPEKWLYHEPIDAYFEGDLLEEIGGWARCRPKVGTSLRFEGRRYEFRPLPAQHVPDGGGVILNMGKSLRQKYRGHVKTRPGPEIKSDGPLTMCLYTVLRNDHPRRVKVFAPFSPNGWQQFVLAGHSLAHGQVVKLDKGLYPLLVILRIQARWSYVETRLDEANAEDLEASKTLLHDLQAKYEAQRRDWEWDTAEWNRTGGFNQHYQKLFEVTRWAMYTHYREGFGTGAAQSDTSGMCGTLGLLPGTYAAAYRNAFGVDVSPYPDMTHFAARRMFAHVYPADGEPRSLSVNGTDDLTNDYFAAHFPIMPEPWKPAMLWAWHRHQSVDRPDDAAEKLLTGSIDTLITRAFLNYPTDLKPRPPQGIMPLYWEAPDFGYFGFRNAWRGEDDFLVQVYGRCQSGHGYSVPNAGNFTIMGLGHVWARAMPSLRLHNQRAFANVVLLPDDETNENARARLLHAKTEPDGAGSVTFDLGDLYASVHRDTKGRPMKLYEKYGNVPITSAFKPSGVAGLRSFAVDYSGRCGAACLFVVVDKITGGRQKLWMWRLKDEVIDNQRKTVLEPGDLEYTTVDGNAVTLARPDGTSMRLTFVSPQDAEIRAEKRSIVYTKTYNRGKGTMSAPGIYARTDSRDAGFLVVATIQRGDPPPVKVAGSGLKAAVTVGKRTIRFDGEKVRIE